MRRPQRSVAGAGSWRRGPGILNLVKTPFFLSVPTLPSERKERHGLRLTLDYTRGKRETRAGLEGSSPLRLLWKARLSAGGWGR